MTANRPAIERLMLYRRGFRDGAGALAHRHPAEPDYMRGYDDGARCAGVFASSFAAELGHDVRLDILRDGHMRSGFDGCEWNPVTNAPASEIDTHYHAIAAEVIIGKNGHYRVCAACSRLPVFKRFQKKAIVR